MGKLNQRALALLIVVAAAAIASYWYWSPHLTLRSMRHAAVQGDADELSRFVDYPKLRDSFKGQFRARIVETMGNSGDKGGFAALGSMLGMAMADQMIDAMIRPEVLMASIARGRMQDPAKTPRAGAASVPASDAPKVAWRLVRKSTDRVIAYAFEPGVPPDSLSSVGFVFDREGFASWKLTEIRLPTGK